MNKKIPIFFFFFVSLLWIGGGKAFSQEYLKPLNQNFVLKNQVSKVTKSKNNQRSGQALSLPFIDDFSYQQVSPSSLLWMENQVFINNNYPINPPTIGVATFDGLNANGQPYSGEIVREGMADSLTSVEIDLGSLTPADSVYLSFYYQMQGNGDIPGPGNEFYLDFKNPDSSWTTVWKITPDSVVSTAFIQVFIPITDIKYFRPEFQFRFKNHATLSGNNDHWNLDYVRLDEGRRRNDFLQDVAFGSRPVSLLKNYYRMPWRHFNPTEQVTALPIDIVNISSASESPNYTFTIRELNSIDPVYSFNSTPTLPANQKITLPNPITGVNLGNYLTKKVVIRSKYFFNPRDDVRQNDTVYHDQVFLDYLAYDDGTAEKAYVLVGSGAKLAYKFHSNIVDTLKGIQIHFSHINTDATDRSFNLTIWKKINYKGAGSDEELYKRDFIKPDYIDSLNGFATYLLDNGLLISGDFYIGWEQSDRDELNVGFDKNNIASENMFYNVDGTWNKTLLQGALMIRPVFGNYPLSSLKTTQGIINAQPNPVINNELLLNKSLDGQIFIYDYMGVLKIQEEIIGNSIDLKNLQEGIYIVKTKDKLTGEENIGKFIKVN